MPEMDGFTLAENIPPHAAKLRGHRHDADLQRSAGRNGRCRELGIAAYLVKPITQAELFDVDPHRLRLSMERSNLRGRDCRGPGAAKSSRTRACCWPRIIKSIRKSSSAC